MKKEIRILSEIYQLKEVDLINDDPLTLGRIDNLRNIIYIKENQEKNKKNVTILHEIMHAIFSQLGFDDEYNNEHLIKSLSSALYQTMFDNKMINSFVEDSYESIIQEALMNK